MRNKRKNIFATSAGSDPDIIPGFTYNELAKELEKELSGIEIQDNDITPPMMAELWKCNKDTARDRLNALVAKGTLISPGKALLNGYWVTIYRKKI